MDATRLSSPYFMPCLTACSYTLSAATLVFLPRAAPVIGKALCFYATRVIQLSMIGAPLLFVILLVDALYQDRIQQLTDHLIRRGLFASFALLDEANEANYD